MNPVTIYWHDSFSDHATGPGHPESSARTAAITDGLKMAGQWNLVADNPLLPATTADLELIHTADHIRFIQQACFGPAHPIDGDTWVSPASFDAACYSVGAGLQALTDVLSGATRTAFIPARPPGHHALAGKAMGFCLFANAAICAAAAIRRHALDRIAIVDWDVHHGNGTQGLFYASENVLYISAHEWPLFPGTGAEAEMGTGAGKGYTINYPLPAGLGDEEYVDLFSHNISEALLSFKPQIIIISAGFDAHEQDPLGHMNISSAGFEQLTSIIVECAEELCDGRVISFLEGGYHLRALAESVTGHVTALARMNSRAAINIAETSEGIA